MDKYANAILTYGYIPMLMVLKEQEYNQNYEVCQKIENGFDYIEKLVYIKYPRELNKDVIEDYISSFWRKGYSGENAMYNMDYYVSEIKKPLFIK